MTRLACTVALTLLTFAPSGRLSAQLLNAAAPIRVGHYHLNVSSIDEHKKFWVDALGGTATKIGSTEAVRFGDVLHEREPEARPAAQLQEPPAVEPEDASVALVGGVRAARVGAWCSHRWVLPLGHPRSVGWDGRECGSAAARRVRPRGLTSRDHRGGG